MAEPSPIHRLPQAFGSTTRGRNAGDYADRHFAGRVRLASGQEISLAMVADGFGERGLAASVSQLAIDTVVEYLQRVRIAEIPDILEKAFQVANKRVGEVVRRQNNLPLSTTLAVAAIYNNRLYIANVGNSRIYLIRGGRMLLLTVEHTVAFEQITSGRLNTDQALHQPNAQQLARSIGFDPLAVKVDLGLYLQGGGETFELARQQQGVELHPDDLILVCSDGLVKPIQVNASNKGPLANRDEIRKTLESNTGQIAAQTLVNLAAQRLAPDDVTAIVLEMPGRPTPRSAAVPGQPPRPPAGSSSTAKTARPNRKLLWISLIALFAFAILAILVVAVVLGISFLRGEKATATMLPSETPAELLTPTANNLQLPRTDLPGATLTLQPSPTSTPTSTPQHFAPTATRTIQAQQATGTPTSTSTFGVYHPPSATSTFKPHNTPLFTPKVSSTPHPPPTSTDWFPTFPPTWTPWP